jgi:hypothetical protein
MFQRTLSLGSLAGILAVIVGVGVGMLILTQFEFGRKLTGAQKGQLSFQ